MPRTTHSIAPSGVSYMLEDRKMMRLFPELFSQHDFYHWRTILRSVSGFDVYRKVYRDVIHPERVAELLILRADMPRSLHACLNEVANNISMVSDDRSLESYRRAGKLCAEMEFNRIEEILANGLHAYLTQFLDRVNKIGASISREFLIPN